MKTTAAPALIGNNTIFPMKSGLSFCFNARVDGFSLIGCRLMRGVISPPQTPRAGKYYDNLYIPEDCALRLYDALASKLQELGLVDKCPLVADRSKAIQKLLIGDKEEIYFPASKVEESKEVTAPFDGDLSDQELDRLSHVVENNDDEYFAYLAELE